MENCLEQGGGLLRVSRTIFKVNNKPSSSICFKTIFLAMSFKGFFLL